MTAGCPGAGPDGPPASGAAGSAAARVPPRPPGPRRGALPKATPDQVAVVVLNLDGRAHLPQCLASALESEGISGPEAVVVADNGSSDGSLALVQSDFPGVRSLPFGRNLGFAGGNNSAAQEVSEPYVLFLNNDTRMMPAALRLLCDATGGDVSCVGARLVSWDGRRLDFDGGGASFTGHGHAFGYGRPVPRRAGPPRQVLFSSGAAVLVHKRTFLDLGGFDSDYFFYYEDVDLGWRHRVAGFDVVHVPSAVVHHRHHGTAHRMPEARGARLMERNALATVAKNYDDDLLARALPAALALAAHRAGAPIEVIDLAVPGQSGGLPLPDRSWPGWRALEPLRLDFEDLGRRRRAVQSSRRTSDDEVLVHLGTPLAPHPASPAAWQAMRRAVTVFGLDERLGLGDESRVARAAVLARGVVGALGAGGPSLVAEELRRYLAWRRTGGGRTGLVRRR